MFRRISICLLLLLLGSIASAASLEGRVTWVYDGDTLEVDGIGRVRLTGIDTPEYKNSGRDQFYIERFHLPRKRLRAISRKAKEFNITTVKGKIVRLESEGGSHDKHGRQLGYVYLPDSRMLNLLLLEKGLATVFRRYDFGKKALFLEQEKQAQKRRVGLWAPAD